MKSFKEFLLEKASKHKLHGKVMSQYGYDFLDHLMSPMVDGYGPNSTDKKVNEATVEDSTAKPKFSAYNVPNMLEHEAVTQRDDPKHVEQYMKLMKNGEDIAKEKGNVSHNDLRDGFNSYMARFNAGEGKEALKEASKHFENYRTERQGYGKKDEVLGANTKIAKNEGEAENSTGLSLAPFNIHGVGGHTNCANSTTNCRHSCLAYTTGQNAMLSNINAKIATTQYLIHHPHHFAAILHKNMLAHIDRTANLNDGDWHTKRVARTTAAHAQALKSYEQAKASGMDTTQHEKLLKNAEANKAEAIQGKEEHAAGKRYTAGFRLNVTSDYDVPHIMGSMVQHVHDYAKSKGIDMTVRDYTKNSARLYKERPSWHFLALSHTGQNHNPETGEHHKESNDAAVSKALDNGHTVAGIVRGDATHIYDHKTKRFYPIVDGDAEDMIEKRHSQAGHKTAPDGTGFHPDSNQKTGVYSALRIKGLSKEIQSAAGNFENKTTDMTHPTTGVPMRVVEINKPAVTKEDTDEDSLKSTIFRYIEEKIDKDKMACNKPRAQAHGSGETGKSHVVKACANGKEKIIRFGQKGVKGSPKKEGESEAYKNRRERFKARHSKNIAKGKMSAAYWANKVKW